DDHYLCIFGGIEPSGDHGIARVYNDTHLLDLTSFAWRKLETAGCRPPARFGHTATHLPGQSGKLLILGGRDHLGTHGDDGHHRDLTGLHILDMERRVWQEQTYSGAPPRQAFYHSACLLDDQTLLIVGGGREQQDSVPLYLLDLEFWTWTRPSVAGPQPLPRIGHAAAAAGGRVYLFGGMVRRGEATVVDKAVYVLESSQLVPDREEVERATAPLPSAKDCKSDKCKSAVDRTAKEIEEGVSTPTCSKLAVCIDEQLPATPTPGVSPSCSKTVANDVDPSMLR
ncbi:unnamed protein product, partial [Polarella glacialis]